MFRTKKTDLLNEAHTLGLGAITAFEKAAEDLESAADLAADHAFFVRAEIDVLNREELNALAASAKYSKVAENLRALVDA